MNSKIKRFLSLSVALALSTALFAGCGNKTDSKASDPANSSAPAASAAPETGYPIVQTPITVKYWTPIHGNAAKAVTNYGEIEYYKQLEKKTNIRVEFIHPAQGMEQETFNVMVASRDIPDLVENGWNYYNGGINKGAEDGFIVVLNDYLDKYAPNYKKVLTSDKNFEKDAKNDKNEINFFATVRPVKTPNQGPIFRKDWLDELGLKVPETIDEWYVVLKAFKDKKNASAPLLGNSTMFNNMALIGAFDASSTFYQDNGKVKYGPIEKEYNNYITTMRKWYAEGLIDPEYASNTTAKIVDAKFTNNQAGAYFGQVGAGFVNYFSSMLPKDPKFNIVAAPYPTLKKGENRDFGDYYQNVYVNQSVCVTATSKYIKEVIRWVDYGFTEEGIRENYFGYEGKTYNMVNGKPQLNDYILKNPDGLPYSSVITKYNRAPANAISVYQDDYFRQVLTFQQQRDALNIWEKPERKKVMPVAISLTTEERDATSQKLSEITTYVSEMQAKFIMGKEPLEKMNEFVEKIKKMGIEECIKVRQAALDRYNKR